MVLPEIGKVGQLKLKATGVLVVGAGGLGCPAIAYLAGAGIGKLGIIDADVVELSNIHRQILHMAQNTGQLKVASAANFVKELNSTVVVSTYPERLTNLNAFEIIPHYDLVLDCSDNQTTRYLLSDVCVLLGKPLVSGSALKMDGQLAVYNYEGGPCYRCMFPNPTPANCIKSCGEAGVLGPVVGVIGVLQALEAIKVIVRSKSLVNLPSPLDGDSVYVPKLTLFSAFGDPQWRSITLRKKRKDCMSCSSSSSIHMESIVLSSNDSEPFCSLGRTKADHDINSERIEPSDLGDFARESIILDVRDVTQYGITHLPRSINVPLDEIDAFDLPAAYENVLIVCRQGNDSEVAINKLRARYPTVRFRDLRGGLAALAEVDPEFPIY